MKTTSKRILALLLAPLFVLFCCAEPIASAVLVGDVDGSGKVNSSDARKALRAAARIETLTGDAFTAADTDGNGKVTATDARKILRAAAKLETLPGQSTESTAPPENKAGYWSLTGARVQKPTNSTGARIEYTYIIGPGEHYCTASKPSAGVWAKFSGFCTPPPAQVSAGESVVLAIRMHIESTDSDQHGGSFSASGSVRLDKPDLGLNETTQNAVIFAAAQAGGKNVCSVACDSGPDTDSAFVGCVFPQGSAGQSVAVYFTACGEETVWTYTWVTDATPTQPSTQPTQPSTQPTQPSTQPTQPSTQPTQPSTEPTQPSTEPTQPSTEPTQPSTEPTVQPTEPTAVPDPPKGQKYEWRLAGVRTQNAGSPGGDISYSYSVMNYQHTLTLRQMATGMFAVIRSTCSEPPAAVEPGMRIVMDLTLDIDQFDGSYSGGELGATAYLRQDAPDLPLDGATQNAVTFVSVQPGGKNQCKVTLGGTASDSAQVYTVFPRAAAGQRISIYYTACGGETVWTYVSQLVAGEPASVTEPVPSGEQPVSGETARVKITGAELAKYQSAADYEICELYRYTKGGAEHVILDDYEAVEFDISNIPAEERQDYLCFYIDEDTGETHWYIPDPEARFEGKLRIETLHYSLFGWGKPSENDLLNIWAERAAAQGVTQRIAEEDITPGLKDMVTDALNAGGLGKDQVGGAIVRFILSHDTKGELLTAAADGDMDSVKKIVTNSTAEFLIGKVLTGEDDSVLYGGIGDNVNLVRKALRDGDYPTATLEIVKNLEKNMFPAVSYAEKFAGLVDKLADIWTDNMLDEYYKEFEEMMRTEGRVTGSDWDTIYAKLRGASVRLNARGVSAADLRAKFDQRYANNEKIKKEVAELMKLIARWRSTGLLNDYYWFGHPSEIEMLNSLRQQRETLREMFTVNGKFKRGRTYNSDEVFLNDAVFRWITSSKLNRAAFYDWLRSEGLLPPLKETVTEQLESFLGKWSAYIYYEEEGWVDYVAGVIHNGWSANILYSAQISANDAGQVALTVQTEKGEFNMTLAEGSYFVSCKTLTVNDQSGSGLAYSYRFTLISDTQMDMDVMNPDGTSAVRTLTKE